MVFRLYQKRISLKRAFYATCQVVFLFFLYACNTNQQERTEHIFAPQKVKAVEYRLPKDSVLSPKTSPIAAPKKIAAGTPQRIPLNLNVHPVPEKLPVFELANMPQPKVNTPGHNGFKALLKLLATKKTVPAGLPEVIKAKDAATKDINPSNFMFYKVLQGLKQSSIRCLHQDRSGNIWLGTYSGGASRFDGRSFTRFTEAQGLGNNVVFCILEDKNKNIWFGTNGGGASCYNGKSFSHFTRAGGLSSDAVYCMMEDKKGNLWFGTADGGVSCYDGTSFTHYTQAQGLCHNTVYSIREDRNGSIWFGTANGASCYNGKTFTNYTTGQGLPNNIVLKITEDRKGNLWFGTVNGASRYDGRSFTNFTEEQGLGGNVVYTILEDKDSAVWFGTSGGISCYDGKVFTNHTEAEGLSDNVVFSILEDDGDNLWFGTNSGLNHYNGNSFSHFTGLGNTVVFSILQKMNGDIWFGKNGSGAVLYDGESFQQYSTEQGLLDNTIYSMLEDRKGNVWFGTDRGISVFDGTSFTNFSEEQGLTSSVVYTLLEDREGNIWLGTDGGGLIRYDGSTFTHFTKEQGLSSNVVYGSFMDKSGKLWFGTYNGVSCYDGKGFIQYTKTQGLISNIVYSILEDSYGNMWFGTNEGVDLFNGSSFTHFTETQGLINNAALSLLQDKAGNIWIGTRMGLSKLSSTHLSLLLTESYKFNPIKEALFYNYSYNDGFLGLNCRRNSVLQDKNGQIWWGADLLTCYKPLRDITSNLPPMVNLTSIKLFGEEIPWAAMGAVFTDSTGKETVRGVINDTTLANSVVLKNIRFNGLTKWYNLPTGLSLPYNNNHITFNFIGIHIKNRNHIKYQYRLFNFDQDWSAISEINEATYGNLSSGTYTFMVKAMNQNGNWSKPVEYVFEVRPVWWKTWWFNLAVIVFIAACIRFYITLRERDRRESEEMLELQNQELRKANAELDRFVYSASHELRAPISSLLGLLNITIAEEKRVAKLQSLEMMKVAIQRLDNFITDIINYSRNSRLKIEYEKIDFEEIIRESMEQLYYMPECEKIDISTDIRSDAEFYSDKKRIGILFNNFLSNAIKYYNSEQKAPYIRINIAVKTKGAYIEIQDNGIGIPEEFIDKIFSMFYRATVQKSGSGLGLYINKEIVDRLGGTIRVESAINEGTTFFVFIPHGKTEAEA